MIPADLASKLRQVVTQDLPAPVQPAAQGQKIADVLSDLVPGQRIMAEIQALLPNGAYRAVVSQRDITLALPFSAKAGDVIELEVTETDGKLSLAFVANRTASEQAASKGNESVATTLSKTGNLIGDLLSEVDRQGGKAKPAALNGNQPLVAEFTGKASDLAPVLKDALAKSGMFYEAHQARWIEGKLNTATLLQEPQGKLSTLVPLPPPQPSPLLTATTDVDSDTHVHLSERSQQQIAADINRHEATPGKTSSMGNDAGNIPNKLPEPAVAIGRESLPPSLAGETGTPRPPIHAELTPLVQQQLNALATQTYVWQGQVWPGQNMYWEITEDSGRPRSTPDEMPSQWQTRLRLDLPHLGGIDAHLRLGNTGALELSLITDNAQSEQTLRDAAKQLAASLDAAGLKLNKFVATHGENPG